jgi:aryl-alcohol dehydrogenase-like predicted oxidoreductase
MKSRGTRSKVYISTKGGHPSLPDWSRRITEADITADMDASLRYLQTDCVDVYFLHRDDETKPVEAIMPVLDKLVRAGKTRQLGASNWTVARIAEANAFARSNGLTPFSVSQIFWCGAVINAHDLPDKTLIAMDETQHAWYAESGMPVMAYTAQAKGLFSHIRDGGYAGLADDLVTMFLNAETKARAERILATCADTGLSPTAVSLAYLLHDRAVKAYPILGISRPERLAEAMQVFSLEQRDIDRLFAPTV